VYIEPRMGLDEKGTFDPEVVRGKKASLGMAKKV
jgi:hypothetical protein